MDTGQQVIWRGAGTKKTKTKKRIKKRNHEEAPTEIFLILLIGFAILSAVYCFVIMTPARLKFKAMDRRLINDIKWFRREHENRIKINKGVQTETQKQEVEVEAFNKKHVKIQGTAHKTGSKVTKINFFTNSKISSGLFVTMQKKTLQFWVLDYEFPTHEHDACFAMNIKTEEGTKWHIKVKENCREADGIIKRFLTATRLVPLYQKNDAGRLYYNSKLYILFVPDNPASLTYVDHTENDTDTTPLKKQYVLGNLQFVEEKSEKSRHALKVYLFNGSEVVLSSYAFPMRFERSAIIINELIKYLSFNNREYALRKIVPVEGQAPRYEDRHSAMTVHAMLVTQMDQLKGGIERMYVVSGEGNFVGEVNPRAIFGGPIDEKGECQIMHDNETIYFADTNCEMIKMDAYMWNESLEKSQQ